jgi:hypothetical protein
MKPTNNEEELQEKEVEISDPVEKPTVSEAKSDFFSGFNPEDELNQFTAHMGVDKEEVDAPDLDLEDELEATEEEKELLGTMSQATEEHKELAKFILIQMDRIMAFMFSLFSGMDHERYQTRLSQASESDYEVEILSGLLYKYQLKMSLEYMFIIAILMVYTPQATKAIKDRRIAKENQQKEAERERMKMYAESIQAPTPFPGSVGSTRIK